MKSVRISIFCPGNKARALRVYTAPPGRRFGEKAIDDLLARTADSLEKQHPGDEYRLVPVVGGFNFVHVGKHTGVEVS